VEREWQPGTPEDKQRARAALAGALDGWLYAGDALLTPEGGWPLGPPASSSDTWSVILYLIAHASDAVARYSEAVMRRGSSDMLEPFTRHAQLEIDRAPARLAPGRAAARQPRTAVRGGRLAARSPHRHRAREPHLIPTWRSAATRFWIEATARNASRRWVRVSGLSRAGST